MELAALTISFASLAAAVASAVVALFQRADALRSADRAEAAQSAADAAAAQALDAYKRSSAALEAMALLTGPPWELEYLSGDAFQLTNTSPLPALKVELAQDSTSEYVAPISEYTPQTIGPRSAVKFMFSYGLNAPFQRNLIVRWKRPGVDEVSEWTHPFPPKPPRTTRS